MPLPPVPEPLVSIVTINYRQAHVTCALLASLRRISYPRVEIIVVDNASPAAEVDPIAAQFPEVRLVRSAENLGFAGGNNLGIAVAQGEYVLFLNNDTEVAPGFLEPLVALFGHVPEAGVASPKIIYHGTDNLIQYAGCSGINAWTGRSVTTGHLEHDRGQYDATAPTALAHGAAMLVPRRLIQQVGLMPALYFLYYEELDWCEMMKRAGHGCHYVGGSTVYHKESASVGQGSVLRTYYLYRNRLLFVRRNLTGARFWSAALFFVLVAVPKQGLLFTLRREWAHLRALGRGLRWHLQPHSVHHNDYLP